MDFGDDFGVLADGRCCGNADFNGEAKGRVDKTTARDVLVKWIASADINIVVSFGDGAAFDIALEGNLDFESHLAEAVFNFAFQVVHVVSSFGHAEAVEPQLTVFEVRVIDEKGLRINALAIAAAMIEQVKQAKMGIWGGLGWIVGEEFAARERSKREGEGELVDSFHGPRIRA
jgi:hypothetical protein